MNKHFIIKSGDENAGFTAYIKFALNGILYAEQHDYIPVVNENIDIGNNVNFIGDIVENPFENCMDLVKEKL
tara:strand:+ start:51029 stop:51244 length:216 start_codon:yes stop_codon:yes gene_type:complete